MESNALIFGIVFASLFAIGMFIGVLVALKRGFIPALVRLGMILLCLLIAIPLTNLVTGILSEYVEPIIHSLLGDTIDQIAEHSPTTMELIEQFPLALVAPILYIVIFFLLKLITAIIFRIIKPLFPEKNSTPCRILGGVAGAVTSLLCSLALFLPLWGLIGICHQTMQTVTEIDVTKNQELGNTVAQIEVYDDAIFDPAVNNFVATVFTDNGNSALYNRITKFRLNGKTVFLGEELHLATRTAADALALVGSLPDNFALTDLGEEHITALRHIAADIDSSVTLKNVFAEMLSSMADAWRHGEDFLGLEDPAAQTNIQPVVHSLYGLLATTDSTLLVSDLNLFIDVLDVLLRHDVLVAQQSDLLKKIGADAFMNDLTAPLTEHDRIRITLSELTASTTAAWASGNAHMGMSEPKLGDQYRAILRAGYGYLATTNEFTFVEDLKTLCGLASMMSSTMTSANILMDDSFLEQFNSFLGEHTRFRDYFASWLAKVAGAWSENKDYDGMTRPASNELVDPVMDTMFGILATTDNTLIHKDLTAMTDIMRVMRNYEVFTNSKSGKEMADILMKSSFVSELNQVINRHERFTPLLDIVASLGLSAISSQLTLALPDSQLLTDLSGNLSTTLNSIAGQSEASKLETIEQEVNKVMNNNKIDVPDGVSGMISQMVHTQFGNQTIVSDKDVSDYLTGLYNNTGNLDGFFK